MVDVKNNNKRLLWRDKWLSYDHTNAEFREWWIHRALDMLAHDEIDGIFVDGLCKVERSFLPVNYSQGVERTIATRKDIDWEYNQV